MTTAQSHEDDVVHTATAFEDTTNPLTFWPQRVCTTSCGVTLTEDVDCTLGEQEVTCEDCQAEA